MSYEVTQSVSLSEDDDYDCRTVPLELPQGFPPLSLKLAGGAFYLVWDNIVDGIYIEECHISVAGGGYSASLDFREGVFPQVSTGQFSFPGRISNYNHSSYAVRISMTTSDWPAGIAGTVGNSDAKSFVTSLVNQKFSDVCLFFPRSGRRLWVTQATLAPISPYFDTLFTSEFAEAAEATEIVEILKSKQQEEEEERGAARDGSYDYDDSDIETDEATKALLHEPKNPSSASFITVRITQHTYETYLALLCWIGTGEIEFAPLRSTFQYPFASGPSAEPIPARAETLLEDIAVSLPRNPIPVSPKSIYRLAHFLELEGELSSLALSNFESQLTVENVMYELYTDVASKYHELRDVAIAFAIKHWSKVLKTRAYKDVLQRADDVGIDGATGLLLSERLSQAWKKGGK